MALPWPKQNSRSTKSSRAKKLTKSEVSQLSTARWTSSALLLAKQNHQGIYVLGCLMWGAVNLIRCWHSEIQCRCGLIRSTFGSKATPGKWTTNGVAPWNGVSLRKCCNEFVPPCYNSKLQMEDLQDQIDHHFCRGTMVTGSLMNKPTYHELQVESS